MPFLLKKLNIKVDSNIFGVIGQKEGCFNTIGYSLKKAMTMEALILDYIGALRGPTPLAIYL